jgi:hypothetical protein
MHTNAHYNRNISKETYISYIIDLIDGLPTGLHPSSLSAFRTHLLNFQISLYTLLLNIIILIPVSLCVVSTTPLNSSASLCISYWSSLKYLQLLLSPAAAYSPFWRRSLSTFFCYPMSRFRVSSSPKKTARSPLLRHVIMSLGPLFWAACPGLGLSRQRGDTSPSAVARTGTSIFPEWPYPLQ